MIMFGGWDTNQWAVAKAMHKEATGIEPPTALPGAAEVLNWWSGSQNYPPLRSPIVTEIKYPNDYTWAVKMLSNVPCVWVAEDSKTTKEK